MIVGLTGGIGSGKTTAAGYFKDLGIPIYIADERAKALMNTSNTIQQRIIQLLGNEAYTTDGLNRVYVAQKVFSNKTLLEGLNAIVHPEVDKDFRTWYTAQKVPYVIKEAAILFENGGYQKCDYVIVVTAPIETRVQRVMKRDKLTSDQIYDRIKNQWSDAKKISMADAAIENITLANLEESVHRLHTHLITRVSRGW